MKYKTCTICSSQPGTKLLNYYLKISLIQFTNQ